MANMKITVVGDSAEKPLTPEEEHRIEVKIDEMLDPSLPDKIPETAPQETNAPEIAEVVETTPAPAVPVTPEISSAPPVPTVTKIVPTFADDTMPQSKEPAASGKLDAPEIAVQGVSAAKKTITVTHYDESESDNPEKPEQPEQSVESKLPTPPRRPVKASKAKAASKKSPKRKRAAAKKAPEDDLASKADAIAASALMAEELMSVPQPKVEAVSEPEEPVSEDAPAAQVPDILPESVNDIGSGAPPLIQKHAAPIITPVEPNSSDTTTPAAIQKSPAPTQGSAPEKQLGAEPAENTPELGQPGRKTDIVITEVPDEAEKIEVDIEPKAQPAPATVLTETAESNKYRPPEGPLQFKRAEVPIKPQKPGEPRLEAAAQSEISEDEALLKAFESPKTTQNTDAARGFIGAIAKLLKWMVIVLIILAVLAMAVVPALRTKALRLVGLHDSKPVSTSSSAPASSTTTAQATLSPDIYVAKRAGSYNMYKIIPGSQEQLILSGTGKEESDLVLAPNANNTIAALVSTRDGKEDSSGALQESLALVTVKDGRATAVDTADQVKLVDWFGERIVYVLVNTSTNTADTNRYQIVSYDTVKKVRTVLDHASYLNDVLGAKGNVYYATSTSAASSGQFSKIQPDGTGKRTILTAEISAITRTAYDGLILAGTNKWYSYELDAVQATATNNAGQGVSRLYITSPDNGHAAYIEESAGVKKLTVLDTKTAKETVLAAEKVSYPIHWLSDNTVAYRSGSSDYSIDITGGPGTKIADVFDAAGISLWHEL